MPEGCGEVERVGNVNAEHQSLPVRHELPKRFDHQGIPAFDVDGIGQLGNYEISHAGSDTRQINIRLDPIACHWGQVSGTHHFRNGSGEGDFLKNSVQADPIAALRRCRKAHEQFFCVGAEQAQVFHNAPIGIGGCMMRFIDDDDRELIGVEARQPPRPAPAEGRNRRHNYVTILRRAFSGLLDFHLERRIGGKQSVPGLMEQLGAMRQNQHAPLHAEKRWELSEDDGLAGAGGQADELASRAGLVPIEDGSQAQALVIAQEDRRLHVAEYTLVLPRDFEGATVSPMRAWRRRLVPRHEQFIDDTFAASAYTATGIRYVPQARFMGAYLYTVDKKPTAALNSAIHGHLQNYNSRQFRCFILQSVQYQ